MKFITTDDGRVIATVNRPRRQYPLAELVSLNSLNGLVAAQRRAEREGR